MVHLHETAACSIGRPFIVGTSSRPIVGRTTWELFSYRKSKPCEVAFRVARFRQHRARQAETQMAAGTLWQDHGLIFASEIGTPMDPDNFSHSFARLCERAGLGHWHPHELRHSGASLMLAQGTPLHVVSEVLGHASIAITKDVYGHLLEGDKRAAAESMSRALFGG